MNQKNFDTPSLRPLALPMYAVAAVLIFIPLSELGSQLGWMAKPDVLNWRTGAVGLASGVVMTPTVGLLLAVVTAFLYEHRWAQRILTVVAGLGALVALAILMVFTLDALQLRPAVTEQMRRPFTVAMLKAMINFGATSVALATIAIGAFRAGRRRASTERAASRATGTEMPLVGATR